MARTESQLKVTMITQQLVPEFWERHPPEVVELVKQAHAASEIEDDVTRLGELARCTLALGTHLVESLSPLSEVESGHAIIHDRDTQEVWDELRGELVTRFKVPHLHLVVYLGGKGATLTQISDAVKFPPAHVEKVKGSPHALLNLQSYLVHAKDGAKAQYQPAQVATIAGRSYDAIYGENIEKWMRGRAVKVAKDAKSAESVDDLIAKCLRGEVRKPQILLTDELFEVYARNKRVIDEAIDTFGQRRAMKAAQKLREGQFKTRVLYVTGPPGAGKSRFSRHLVDATISMAADAGERWEMYKGASSNPLDNYAGEEVILLDDLRPGAMLADDWLHLLDPESADAASARYKNKENIAPRLIVVTAFADPLDFFFFTKSRGGIDEAMDQFMRRLAMVCRVLSAEEIPGVYRFHVDLIGKRQPYTRTVETAKGTSSMVNLNYGMVARGRTNSDEAVIDYLLQDFRQVWSDVPWSRPMQLEPGEALDIIDGEVIAEEAHTMQVVGRWADEQRRKAQDRERYIATAMSAGKSREEAAAFVDRALSQS